MRNDLTMKIKTKYFEWTKSEKKVAEFILDNKEKIGYFSVTEVAEKCNVGEATVLRFCKKMGCTGFYSFKKRMLEELEEEEKKQYEEEKITNKAYEELIEVIDETLKLQREEEIFKASRLINNAESIYILGEELSNLSAKAAEVRLSCLGYKSFHFDESKFQVRRANLIGEKDLVIAVCVSENRKELIESLKIAKKNGATIIGIANYKTASLVEISDCVILSASKDIVEENTLIGVASQLFIIEEICNELIKIN